MNSYKKDYIAYRIARAGHALTDARLLADNGSWNSTVNRLYYACYYMVSALLLQNNINARTHTGCKTQFGLHFVKTGKVPLEQGRLYADLMDWRQKGDYGDMFDFDMETVQPLFVPVENLLNTIKALIEASK
jgi:uncharacterized protein (UPF0332 family)